MKKMLLVLLVLAAVLFTTFGCSSQKVFNPLCAPNWVVLCSHTGAGGETTYVYDVDTEIVYVFNSRYQKGAFSVYYNSNGEPMTKAEFETIHMNKYH